MLQDPQGTLKLVFLKMAQYRHALGLQAAAVGLCRAFFSTPDPDMLGTLLPAFLFPEQWGVWSVTVGISMLQMAQGTWAPWTAWGFIESFSDC